jgi:hypothetical protein
MAEHVAAIGVKEASPGKSDPGYCPALASPLISRLTLQLDQILLIFLSSRRANPNYIPHGTD